MTDRRLTQQANFAPDAVFLETGDQRLTYSEVEQRVSVRARDLGDRTGQQIVVRPRIDVESVVELLAVTRVGATAVVVSPQLSHDLAAAQIEAASREARPCQSILFTSGSSGGPKGVRFSAANWEAAAAASMASLGHGPGDRWLCPLPLHHVGGLSIILRSLAAGGRVMLAADLDQASRWLDRVQFASTVPTQLHRILLRRSDAFTNSPRVLVGGGQVDRWVLDKATTAGLTVLPTYGMTETTSQVATARSGDPKRRLFALHGVEIRIGAEEQIEVKGPTVSLGYVGEPERSQGDWFYTSDRGRIEPDGSLVVLGRLDRLIISGGEKVDPSQVETAIGGHPDVVEVAVIGLPDEEWGEIVAAAYAGSPNPEQLRVFIAGQVPNYAVPKRWRLVEALPRTELGKVDGAALLSLFDS